jgi:hypothetical protein
MSGCLRLGVGAARERGRPRRLRFTSRWRCVESPRRAGAQRSRERRALARRVKRGATHFYLRLGGRMSGCLRLGVGAARERGRPRRLASRRGGAVLKAHAELGLSAPGNAEP